MNFGSSVSDFVLLGQVAWKIYRACKDSPEDFKNVSQEVLSLHVVLKKVQEMYLDASLSADQQSSLRVVGDGCRGVLEDLQEILDKYTSLGTKSKRPWDRLGWGSEDIEKLRLRLISNTVLLLTFVTTSQTVRGGKHEGSIFSAPRADSLSADERQAWRTIRKELEDIGICIAPFDANKDSIMNWFRRAISTGAFEEQTAEDGSGIMSNEDDPFQDPGHETVLDQPSLDDPGHDTENVTSTFVNTQPLISSEEPRIQRRRSSRGAGLIKWLLQDNKEIFKAVQSKDETKMQQLLKRGVNINMKDCSGKLPLHRAVSSKSEAMVRILLQNGADVDARTKSGNTALHIAAKRGHETIVHLLLKNGAEIHAKDEYGNAALHLAAGRGHKLVVKLLLRNGARINEKNGQGYTQVKLADSWKRLEVASQVTHHSLLISLIKLLPSHSHS